MNILLVDDDQVDRALIVRALKKSDLQPSITEALSVDEGLRLYSKELFDIVLLDYRMPERDGIEMIVELRNEPKNQSTAIVMMSASEDEELALQCIRAGAQDFITKSEISETRLQRALLHATTRFELEKQLYEAYQKVKSLAETDALTGLSNRYLFDEALKQAIVNNRRKQSKLALLLFDLDNFKFINDNFGHDIGDLLLKKVVNRIKGCLRGNELFSRLGGDEFAITLTNIETEDSASLVALRILRVLIKPFSIATTSIKTTASIGIALHPDNGSTSESLFKFADIAMYRAKKMGKNQVCFFEPEMQKSFQSRLTTEMELREALSKNQLELYYQPVVNPNDKCVIGFEALLRWNINDAVRTPDEFIGVAEETHQICAIGGWVIEEAISTLAKWNAKRARPWSMAINVSAIQLSDNVLIDCLDSTMQRYNIDPRLIDIELTETALMKDNETTLSVITGIHNLGVRLSLDDFGTGFSSVSHIRNYPISVVKIDRSLMPENENDKKNSALIEGLEYMASVLGLEVVAEGVETKQQESLCLKLNIPRVQGFFYSKPVSAQVVERDYLNKQP
ncbi:MAG: EAL domain-containing protein [Agarilytica sp.]